MTDHESWYYSAPLRLHLGDIEGYRQVCREMLTQFGQTRDPRLAERTAKDWLLLPDAVGDTELVQQLAVRATSGTAKHAYYLWFVLVRALADYRQGQYDQALNRFRKIVAPSSGNAYLDGTAPAWRPTATLALMSRLPNPC